MPVKLNTIANNSRAVNLGPRLGGYGSITELSRRERGTRRCDGGKGPKIGGAASMAGNAKKKLLAVLPPVDEKIRRVLERTSMERALRMESLGLWERSYDNITGELNAFRLKARVNDSSLKSADEDSYSGILPSEMETNAFARGTGDRFVARQLAKVDREPKTESDLGPDSEEVRVLAKVYVWSKVGPKRGAVLLAWPKGVS